MKMFQPWNDSVRLLSGDWALPPGRKPTAFNAREMHETEPLILKVSSHPAVRSLPIILLTLIMIL